METLFHGGGGYNDFNVCLPGAPFKGGVCLVAAPRSNQTECSSECLNEFTPRATKLIIHNGERYNPMNTCNHVLLRQRNEEGRRE